MEKNALDLINYLYFSRLRDFNFGAAESLAPRAQARRPAASFPNAGNSKIARRVVSMPIYEAEL